MFVSDYFSGDSIVHPRVQAPDPPRVKVTSHLILYLYLSVFFCVDMIERKVRWRVIGGCKNRKRGRGEEGWLE